MGTTEVRFQKVDMTQVNCFDDYFFVYVHNATAPPLDQCEDWVIREMTSMLQKHEREYRNVGNHADRFSCGVVVFVKESVVVEPVDEILHESMVAEPANIWCQVVEEIVETVNIEKVNLTLSGLLTGHVRIGFLSPNALALTYQYLEPLVCYCCSFSD